MSNIKEQIRQEIERRIKSCDATSKTPNQLLWAELSALLPFIDSLPEDASCTYDTNELTPIPSVNIEDVARVQFASHAHVFDRKRKAVFDWEQFKEVAGIFYGFGKRDSQPEEKPSEDLKEAAIDFAYNARKQLYSKDYAISSIADYDHGCIDGFIAGAEWMRKKDVEDMYMSDNRHFLKCYEQGKVDMKEQMMKDAVEGDYDCQYMTPAVFLDKYLDGIKDGDKVRIIIVKED